MWYVFARVLIIYNNDLCLSLANAYILYVFSFADYFLNFLSLSLYIYTTRYTLKLDWKEYSKAEVGKNQDILVLLDEAISFPARGRQELIDMNDEGNICTRSI